MKKQSILLFAFLCNSFLIQAQNVTTFTGGSPDDGIAIDSQGSIYASNFTGDTVFKFNTSGDMSVFISGLTTPNGLAFDSNDNLYLNDWQPSFLRRYDSNGNLDDEIFIQGNVAGMIKAFDNDDMIYTRYTANTIHRITPSGSITEVSSDPALNGPVGLAYDEFGNLYVGNYNNREIYMVQANGDLQYVATVGASSNLGFIAYAQGKLWGTVLGEHKIYHIDPTNTDVVTLFAGSTAGGNDGTLNEATFNQPNGIAFSDDEQTMYVTDFGSKNLRVISGINLASDDFDSSKKAHVLPNPVKEHFEIILPKKNSQKKNLLVYDIYGKLLLNDEVYSQTINVDSSHWSQGVYFIEVYTNNERFTTKVIK